MTNILTTQTAPATARVSTRALLACGAAAGPVYIVVGLAQALTREGFDLSRHALSLLANGDFGWIQIANLVISGILTIAGAAGIRRALLQGRGRAWGPRLLAVYGLSLVAAGVLVADPALGFPLGTPDGPPVEVTWQGIGHFVAGGIGFLALIVACFVFARRFAALGRRGWAVWSAATGVIFFAAFAGISSGNQAPAINMAFGVAVVAAWTWITALCVRLRSTADAR